MILNFINNKKILAEINLLLIKKKLNIKLYAMELIRLEYKLEIFH